MGVGQPRRGEWGCGGEGAKVPEREGADRRPKGEGCRPDRPGQHRRRPEPPAPYPIYPRERAPACNGAPLQSGANRRPLKGVGGWGVGMPEGGAGAERRGRGGGGGRPRQQRGWDLYRLAPSPDRRSVWQIILPVIWAGHIEIAGNIRGLFGLVRPELPNGRIESIGGHIALLHMHHGHLVGIRP